MADNRNRKQNELILPCRLIRALSMTSASGLETSTRKTGTRSAILRKVTTPGVPTGVSRQGQGQV